MSTIPRIILRPRRARPFFARHPWVFASSIAGGEEGLSAGDEVEVASHEGVFVARGLYNPVSAIRVRLYRWEEASLDEAFWAHQLDAAIRLRRGLWGDPAALSAERLIYSEADGLSGLVVDRYDRWAVAQFSSRALFERRSVIVPWLQSLPGIVGVVVRTERSTSEQEGFSERESQIEGEPPPKPIEILENELIYKIDILSGQKTGFYLDQRENRLAAARYARGRRVLDLFCYSGGFGLTCLKHGGATHVLGIDSSAPAIAQARTNAVANRLSAARFETADVFGALESLRRDDEKFGLVICDPPKFARKPQAVEDALRAYVRLNRAAIELIEPGGFLVTCSCSGHVDRLEFARILAKASEVTGREVQILEQRGQAPDHPIAATCLESDYLKCFICRVT